MKKNILVVDDSALMRRVLCDIINSDDDFQAVDVCRDGVEAYEKLKARSYDGVVLDINMPRMDGLQLLQKLKDENIKATVIVVSTLTTRDADITLQALNLGAIDFITKPTNIIEAKGGMFRSQILSMLSAVIKSRAESRHIVGTSAPSPMTPSPMGSVSASPASTESPMRRPAFPAQAQGQTQAARPVFRRRTPASGSHNQIVALACSTGGPKALQSVIPFLPKNLDAPMVLVQHMPEGFTKSMAERLDSSSSIRVKEAEDGERLQKGCVYVAKGGKHMEVKRNPDGSHKIALNDSPAISGLKPCANITYESLCSCGYDEVICVVLTGMGADGTNGILTLSKHKPIHVIAQNAETCVVYGMPKAIAETGLVDQVVPLTEVADMITKKVGVK